MKEIIEKLKQDGTVFTINGITDINDNLKQFKISETKYEHSTIFSVEENNRFTMRSMNVKKYTPSGIVVYDYDMFGQRGSFKIKYKDVTIVEEPNK